MVPIENGGFSGSLLKNVPKDILGKLNVSFDYFENDNGDIELIILYGEKLEIVKEKVKQLGATFENLGYGFAIVTVNISKLNELALIPEIQYIEFPKSLFYSDSSSNVAACVDRARNEYDLDGEGVLIGFIDTGIDFTHPAFLKEDKTTRIEYIYDLSLRQVFNKDKINEALKSNNPYDIIPSYDVIEHGTHVAGIACAGGNINPKYYGVAPKSSIIMVKSGRELFSLSTNLLRGLRFLLDKSYELNMPLVINISMSTNDGAHNGTSLLEQYISTIARSERIIICIAAGNEGDAAHHKSGKLKEKTIIRFQIAEDETAIVMNLYKSILPEVSIELIAPTGDRTGAIVLEEGYKAGVISGNRYQLYDTGPKPFDIAGEIGISLISEGNNILAGEWTLIVNPINKYEGIYDIWLPISEGVNKDTKFLQPTTEGTLGIPATVSNVVSVGSYNYRTRNISSFSGIGRFYPLYFVEKPDIVAPGEGILGPVPNGSYDNKTGTSMATPHVSGICALMMQWGIVKGYDKYLYSDRLKKYLLTGAKKIRRDIQYPDNAWGYGEVCASESLNQISDNLNIIKVRGNKYREKNINQYKSVEKYLKSLEKIDEKVGYLVEYTDESVRGEIEKIPGISIQNLSPTYALVYLPVNQIQVLQGLVTRIVDFVNPQIFTLTDISPIEASDALQYHNSQYLKLNGSGVLIGIVDTGIDYLGTEFQKEDDTTRIVSLWDQTIDSDNEINGFKMGTEYTEEQINAAINLNKSGGDPYSIVPSKDINGHGTMVAGLAAARGKNPELVGVAPQADLVIVKLKPLSKQVLELNNITTNNVNAYGYFNVVVAIRYLVDKFLALNKPGVVILPVGTNMGPHDGQSLISFIMESYARRPNTIIVTGTGNEGNTETHIEDRILDNGDSKSIELKVGAGQKTLNFEIWISYPDLYSMSVISPSGESFERVPIKYDKVENFKFAYEGTLMEVRYVTANKVNGDESIIVRAINLKEGIWKFVLYGDYVVEQKYFAWLPQRDLLDPDTKFLNANINTTLSDQATSEKVLSVAYYNQNNDTITASSGRGYTKNNHIKPDVAAGGVGANIVRPGNLVGKATGSSVATAIAGGVVANMLQFTAVEGNEPNIIAQQAISVIIRGASTRPGDSYPNRELGYGMINETEMLNAIRGEFRTRSNNQYKEYNIGNLFVRMIKS